MSSEKQKGVVRWKLRELMDEHQVAPGVLATRLQVANMTVSRWRKAKFLPAINEKRYVQLVVALNELSLKGGGIQLSDLIEFCPNEVREDDVFEYKYPTRDERHSPSSSKNNSSKASVAA